MMSSSFHLPDPDHVAAGTVGPPGARVFYLQVGSDGAVATFKLEKQQMAALAEYLSSVIADLAAPEPPILPAPDLIEPVVPEWTVGGIGIAVDEEADRIILVVHELVPETDTAEDPFADPTDGPEDPFADPDDDEPDAAIARIRLTRTQVAAFIGQAADLVTSGRPLCPFCGLPDGPDGHICPRAN